MPPKTGSGAGAKGSDSESQYDTAEDDILEAVVRSATSVPTSRQRERRKARNADRKSCKSNCCLVICIHSNCFFIPLNRYRMIFLCLFSY